MRCPACGQEIYGIVHNCPSPSDTMEPADTAAPAGSGLVYYLREAFAIARWDDFAVQRAARDNMALLYGLLFWTVAFLLGLARGAVGAAVSGRSLHWGEIIGAALFILPAFAVFTLVYYGVCHLLARWLFGGTGSYLAVLRPMMLSSVVQWAAIIPIAGGLLASLWGLGVFMYVLSEVERIERMQAVGISIGLGLILLLVLYFVLSSLPRP